MKKLLVLTAIVSTAFIQILEATPFLPHLGPIRTEIVNQQVIASNAPTVDKKLLTSLRTALKFIDKGGPTNVANDLKTLSLVAKTLNRTSVSNEFQAEFGTAISIYFNLLNAAANSSSNRLLTTFPGRLHDAADKALDKVFNSLSNAAVYVDVVAEAKLLSAIAKAVVKADVAVDRAENAPPPPAGLAATISGALHASFNDFNTTITQTGTSIGVNSQTKPSARGFDSIILELLSVSDGTHTVSLRGAYSQVRPGGRSFGGSNPNGTATITFNSATGQISGTFSFVGDEGGGSTATVTVSGSFSGTKL